MAYSGSAVAFVPVAASNVTSLPASPHDTDFPSGDQNRPSPVFSSSTTRSGLSRPSVATTSNQLPPLSDRRTAIRFPSGDRRMNPPPRSFHSLKAILCNCLPSAVRMRTSSPCHTATSGSTTFAFGGTGAFTF